ncbi:phenylacetate--CoA ligase PaaK [Arthrobacter rhizosphaerae]|uniref:phenylacetate--CoA ligase PaaK n=1 Tax=Arthrobacter rhizosphaerae TaxID=2855490 RepID=UPI001FF3AC4A|nr:phenylacetate--CoA ligase PaaK [Arthrobacter rhizosphaerae]
MTLHATEPASASNEAVLDREETMSRDELEALQLKRLQDTVAYAYERVPLYKRKFDEAGVHPSDLEDLADLGKFPFTTKEDLRQEYPFGMFAVPQNEVARVHASSGTTGRPTVVGYTKQDLADWAKLVARCLRASGVRPGMKVHNAYGYGLFTGGLGAHAGAELLGCTVIPMSGGQTERQIQLIQDFEPDAILCTPTYLLTIADAMIHAGIDPASTSLKYAVLGAEPWTEEMRHELEATMNIKACDIYGLSEVMGPGVAGEAVETQDGSHIWEDHFRPEIIDAFNPVVGVDAVLGDGEHGELVFTSLTKEALPIVRYRTKDLTRLLPGTARPAHRRMGRITGRSDDMIILRGVNLFPSQIEEIALRIPELSPHFQLELTRPEGQRMDQMTVKIERRESVTPEQSSTAAQTLREQIKIHVGSSCEVAVVEPGTLERSSGKLRRIYDLRPKGQSGQAAPTDRS